MAIVQKIMPCLWFDDQAEDAVKFDVSIFDNSSIETVARYGKESFEVHGRPEGSEFTALNARPIAQFEMMAGAGDLQMKKLDLPALSRAYEGIPE
jgi:predicted 3-demethylubiquinone-9 3-methyltransferase (glyoxalase superfamily)